MKKVLSILLLFFVFALNVFSSENSRTLKLEKSFLYKCDSYSLQTFYSSLTRDEKIYMIKVIQDLIKDSIPQVEVGDEEPSYLKYLKKLKEIVNSYPNVAINLVDSLDLDNLIVLKPKLYQYVHEYISNRKCALSDIENFPAYTDNARIIKNIKFYDKNEYIPSELKIKDKFNVKYDSGKTVMGNLKKIIDFPENTIANSINLAKILNQVSNYETKYQYSKIKLTLNDKTYLIETPSDIIDLFYDNEGFEIRGYEGRTLVNYANLAVKTGYNKYKAIEIPTNVTTQIDTGLIFSDRIAIPANHSEQLLAIYKKGNNKPFALVKWFMDPKGLSWEPKVYTRYQWTGYKLIHTYSKKATLLNLVGKSRKLMKLIGCLTDEYKLPLNGYGVLAVCNDSTALMEAMLGQSIESPAWPTLRDIKFDKFYKNYLDSNNLTVHSLHLNVISDVYPGVYYNFIDYDKYSRRIAYCVPFRNYKDIKGKIFRKNVMKIMKKFPKFKVYLRRTVTDQ